MYFVANWKMYGDLKALNSLDKVIKFSKSIKQKKIKLIYCPPSTLINSLSNKLKKTKIEVGAQNSHESDKYGACTGQINSKMLKNVGARYVILGHSENRQLGEDNKKINSKIKSVLKSGLKVIFCIGETFKERRNVLMRNSLFRDLREEQIDHRFGTALEIDTDVVREHVNAMSPRASSLMQ